MQPAAVADQSLKSRLQELREEGIVDAEEEEPTTHHMPSDPCRNDTTDDHDPVGADMAMGQSEEPTVAVTPQESAPKPRFFTSNNERRFSKQKPAETTQAESHLAEPTTQHASGTKVPTHAFSRPKPGDFSYRRRRPDVSALRRIIESLND